MKKNARKIIFIIVVILLVITLVLGPGTRYILLPIIEKFGIEFSTIVFKLIDINQKIDFYWIPAAIIELILVILLKGKKKNVK